MISRKGVYLYPSDIVLPEGPDDPVQVLVGNHPHVGVCKMKVNYRNINYSREASLTGEMEPEKRRQVTFNQTIVKLRMKVAAYTSTRAQSIPIYLSA